MSLALTPDPGRPKTHAGPHETLTEPVFVRLLKDWQLLGCIRTPGLSDVISQASGAAVRDRCPSGTGWPAGASA